MVKKHWYVVCFPLVLLSIGAMLYVFCPQDSLYESSTNVEKVSSENYSSPEDSSMALAIGAVIAVDNDDLKNAAKYYYDLALRMQEPRFSENSLKFALKSNMEPLALKASLLWSSLEPDNDNALHSSGYLLFKQGQDLDALNFYEKIFSKKPIRLNFHTPLLPTKLRGDAFASKLNQWEKDYNNNPIRLTILSLLWSEFGNQQKAQQLIDRALEVNPQDPQAMGIKTQFLLDNDQVDEAKAYLQKMADAYPDNDYLHLLMGDLSFKTKDFLLAEKHYKPLLQHPVYSPDAAFALGRIAMLRKDFDTAEQYLTQSSAEPDLQQQSYWLLAETAREKNQTDNAMNWYTRVTDDPYYFPARVQMVFLLDKEKKYDEAINILQSISARTLQEEKQIVILESSLYIEKGDFEKAFSLLTKSLTLFPEDANILYLRSQVALALNHEETAENDLTLLVSMDPDNVDALNSLGFLLLDNPNRLEEAQGYLLKALSLSPENPNILDSVGWMYYQRNNVAKALEYLAPAYEKAPTNSDIAAHYGEALWKNGDHTKAKSIWKKALQNEPNNETLLEMMRY